jgi:hypothetical protein
VSLADERVGRCAMDISSGWVLLLGGLSGALGLRTSKELHRSDFVNHDGVVTEEDRNTRVHLSPKKRVGLIALCLAIAILGVWMIERDHNWNPLALGVAPSPMASPTAKR